MGKCLQITFGIINFLLWLGGAGLFGLSVWLVVNPESFFDFAEDTNNLINGDNATLPAELETFVDKISNGLYLSMAAGIILLLIGFLGCCGAARKNRCMLNSYAIVMILAILFEIAVAVVIFVYSSDVDTILLDILGKYHPTSTEPEAQTLREFVDNLQESQNCCGWTGKSDYAENQFLGNTNSTVDINVPDSCCDGINNTSNVCLASESDYLGCQATLRALGWIVGGIAAGCVLIELLAVIAACCIRKKEKNMA